MEEVFLDSDSLNPKNKGRWRALKIALASLAILIVIAIGVISILKTYCTTSFIVEGSSMLNTLDGGESADQYPIDSDEYKKALNDGDQIILWTKGKIKKQDIVVCHVELLSHAIVKRVIATAGDYIKIVDYVVYLNGTAIEEPYIKEAMSRTEYQNMWNDDPDSPNGLLIPDGHVFVMGDNRNHSTDSRAFGTVPLTGVEGKAIIVISCQTGKLRFI